MTDLEIDMRDGKDRLREIQREVGWPSDTDDYERITPELQEAYITALEAAVVGTVAAMKGIARSLRRPT
jgi:hypothetical protein